MTGTLTTIERSDKTYVTELNSVILALLAIAAMIGVEIPGEIVAPVVTILNVLLRLANKKGWV